MKLNSLKYLLLVFAVFFASCSTTQKVTLDPIQISANAVGANIYHGSYPKISDIIDTKLDISFDWDSAFVIGKAYINAKPYFYPSNQLILNAKGFIINEISLVKSNSNGVDVDLKQPLTYTYDGKNLTISLDKTYDKNQNYTVFIDYVAMPYKLKVGKDIASSGDRGIFFINRDGKSKDVPKQIWTQGETECNSSWFPTIDGPQEKMTQEISITVPQNLVTLSNGELDYSSNNANGTRTDTWRQDKPHATYLTMMAVGDFVITKDKWRDKEVSYYMEPKFAPYAKKIFGKTPEMIEFFSKKTGVDFPWDKYSQIVVREFISGAMENTSATVFFDRLNMDENQYLDESYEEFISHELFHHWFGDLVTCESWANLPLNESFAVYGEYLWNEFKYGRDFADFNGWKNSQNYFSDLSGAQKNVIRYNYSDREQMFDNVSYEKGGRILHMLRKTVGDDAFFKSLNLYLTKNAYKNVEINDLRLAFEEVTGQDLNWFFNQWFLASGHPKLTILSSYDPTSHSAKVTIKQLQDLTKTPLYRLPLAIDMYVNGKVERHEVVINQQDQTFTFPVNMEPQLINVDAEKVLLADKSEVKTLKQYIFQYENAPLFMDRLEAITALLTNKKDASARALITKALKDENWFIRKAAVDFVGELTSDERNTIYTAIKDMAINDERSYVRAAAVAALKQVYSDKNNKEVLSRAAKDKAPSVIQALSN